MRRSFAYPLVLATALSLPVMAQDSEEEEAGGPLVRFLENTLSGDNRQISVTGLEGAFSSRATIQKITVADDEGVWLTVSGAVLDWNRLALVRGRFSVNTLSADEIIVARTPAATETDEPAPTPEAQPFQVPELPVSIELGEIRVDRVSLGEPLLGLPAELSVDGNLTLADGALDTSLDIVRLDRPGDAVDLTAQFVNETSLITLDLAVTEAEGGLISKALKIPDEPPISLTAKGTGPVTDFTADILLASSGVDRVSGQVRLHDAPPPEPDENGRQSIAFQADLAGDVTPFLSPEFHEFFGEDTSVKVDGRSDPDGRLEINDLQLASSALTLGGKMSLSGDGTLEQVLAQGRIAPPEGGDVVLPIGEPRTAIGAARFNVRLDAATDNTWDLTLAAEALDRPDLKLAKAALMASGTLDQGDVTHLRGTVDANLNGIAFTDDALAQAVGTDLSLAGGFAMLGDGVLQLSDVEARGDDFTAGLDGRIDGLDTGFEMTGTVRLGAADLSRFSGLAGQELGGSVTLQADGTAAPLSGSFDVVVDARGQDLASGLEDIDPIIAGTTTISVDAARGASGIELRRLELAAQALDATASGTLRTTGGGLDLDGKADLDIPDLSVFSELAGQELGGSVRLAAEGQGAPQDLLFDAKVQLEGRDVTTGIEQVDALTGGHISLVADAARSDPEITVRQFELLTESITATADGKIFGDGEGLDFAARLDDLARVSTSVSGPLEVTGRARSEGDLWQARVRASGPGSSVADLTGSLAPNGDIDLDFDATLDRAERFVPEIVGSVSAKGSAGLSNGVWSIDASAAGPAGIDTTIVGTFDQQAQDADLKVNGQANLAIANRFISPNSVKGLVSYDLALVGKPSVEAISGTISTSGTSVAIPSVSQSIKDLSAKVDLKDASANLLVNAQMRDGGGFRVSGPVALTAPFDGRIVVDLLDVVLTDNIAYFSTAGGQIVYAGPLAGNGNISGKVLIGETDIDIAAAGGMVGAASIPQMSHGSEPAAVHQTRQKANLITEEKGGSGPAIGLDVLIDAPNKIFVFGRGLNAELGGSIHVGGTTARLVPSGQIELIRGNFDLLGRNHKLVEGRISLQGDLTPFVEFTTTSSNSEGTATLQIIGPLDQPEVNVWSDPEKPQEEALAMLLFGNSFSQLSPFKLAQIAASLATLSGAGGGAERTIRNRTGADSVDLGTDASGAGQLGAGAYLGENLYTDITVNTRGESVLNLNLDVTESLTLRGSVENTGETGIGVFFDRDY